MSDVHSRHADFLCEDVNGVFVCEPCECGGACDRCKRDEDGPTDDEIYNRPGVEGGIGYDLWADMPGNNYLGEHDPRL